MGTSSCFHVTEVEEIKRIIGEAMYENEVVGPDGSPVSGGGSTSASSVAWSTAWDMTAYKDMGDYPITGALALVSDDGNSIVGGCTQATLIANGSNTPTLDGVAATSYGYVTTNGARNLVQLFRAGASKFWVCGAYTGAAVTTPVAPTITVAPIVGSAVVGVALSFTSAAATGTPSPTITYDVLIDGVVDQTNITSGSYTPSASGVSLVVRATATNSQGEAQSSSTPVTVSAGATAPSAPTGLTLGAATSVSQALSWSAPAGNGGSPITDYVVQWSPAGAGTWTTFSDGTSTVTSATVTGLSAGTSYDYRVAAVNAIGQGSYSSTATGATSSVTYLRQTSLTAATETGSGPYTYVGSGSGGCAGAPNLSLASLADGEFFATLNAMPASFCGMGFATTSAAGIYSTFKYLIYANTNLTGTGSYLFGLNGAAGGVLNGTAVVPAAGDILRMSRSGANLTVQVARAATPTTWTTMHTITGTADTGQLYPRCIMNANGSSITMTDQVGLT